MFINNGTIIFLATEGACPSGSGFTSRLHILGYTRHVFSLVLCLRNLISTPLTVVRIKN